MKLSRMAALAAITMGQSVMMEDVRQVMKGGPLDVIHANRDTSLDFKLSEKARRRRELRRQSRKAKP